MIKYNAMERLLTKKLIEWKNKQNRKPLIINGARQVGKTWLMEDFGKNYFEDYIYINCDNNESLKKQFDIDFNIERIIKYIEIYSNKKIIEGKTLIIFDEIQEIPKAISCLKYFCENKSFLHIICAGSLLGISLHEGASFPVGKVETLNLYPLSFKEFLLAASKKDLCDLIINREYDLIVSFKEQYENLLKTYFFVGGMPEVVNEYLKDDLNSVREIQKRILHDYELDFSKHTNSSDIFKIRDVWKSIVKNLDKENKKFSYNIVKKGSRAKDYEMSLLWLCDAGLIHRVNKVNNFTLPLVSYEDEKFFKVFMLDVGLLTCMTGLDKSVIFENDKLLVEFKGALTENFVNNEIISNTNLVPYYYSNDRSTLEIDFVIDNGKEVIPIEVKSSINLRSRSLKSVIEKYNIKKAYRFSLSDKKENDVIEDYPLYALPF